MESKMNESFECNNCIMDKIETEEINGIAYAHAIGNTEKSLGSYILEYKIVPVHVSSRKWEETRAHREMSRRAGKPVSKIKKNALRDELIILPGAAMSAADVVRALRRCIKELKETGMYIGRYECEYIIESVDGKLELA
jgi:peptidoglycan/xylan/chitin deacetylase (PgdA/CDA1 family)